MKRNFDKSKHIVSFSGGKDSTAMLLRMIELNYKIDVVLFADTTLEFREIYDWIKKIESIIPYKITIVTAKHSFKKWFYGKWTRGKNTDKIRGFPFVTRPCWWQRDCKDIPMKRYCKGNVTYIGIAKDEERRSKRKAYSKGKFKFPLIEWGWSEQDCFNYLESKGLAHPLKNKFKRTGCYLCPKQSKESLKNLFLYYPKLWDELKKLEKDSPQGFKPNFNLKEFEEKIKNEMIKELAGDKLI